jgi:hypothetical protein
MDQVAQARRFSVRARHVDGHHARILEEASFEAAAVAYLEGIVEMSGDDTAELRVIVRDLDSGHEHCFTVDLETGETEPCD